MDKEDIVWKKVNGDQTVSDFIAQRIVFEDEGSPKNYEKARGLLLLVRVDNVEENEESEAIILVGDTNLEGGVCDCHPDSCIVLAWSDSLVDLVNSL